MPDIDSVQKPQNDQNTHCSDDSQADLETRLFAKEKLYIPNNQNHPRHIPSPGRDTDKKDNQDIGVLPARPFLVSFETNSHENYTLYTMRTSYSAIETYFQCPQKYKFQEIDRIKIPKSREAQFGTLVHKALQFMFAKDPLFPTLDQVIAYFREHWPKLEAFNAESGHDPLKRPWTEAEERIYFQMGVTMLKNFYERNAPWNYTVTDLESHFEVVLLDETTGKTHILAGKMDRIDKTPTGYEIIDYKTSKRMPSQAALDENLQLALYSLGLQKRWPHLKPEEISLSLYFLKHGEKLSTSATQEKTEKTKEHILKTIQEIEARLQQGKEFEPMPSPLCNWCGFRPYCPAWKHLYRKNKTNDAADPAPEDIKPVIKEYFALKKSSQIADTRLAEVQSKIKNYMDAEGLTRVFGDEGYISKKTQQRYQYDFGAIKALLSPLGKWEEVLKADETKLRQVMKEVPESVRSAIESARSISKEYTVLTASTKKVIDSLPEESEDGEKEN